jgi:NAD(P)-dependent dehydrogenase (short-subunit alcohol dehydrogenase family)
MTGTDPLPGRAGTHAGRVAVVTGAAGGIGQEICVGLADRGATVVALDIQELDATWRKLGGAPHQVQRLDVTSRPEIDFLAERVQSEHGRCDILVNNAARLESQPWDELEFELWRQVMAVNLDGPMLMCKAIVPLMRRNSWGRIVNIASGSVMQPIVGSVAYRASKMGLIGLTRALCTELGEDGITINAACPSITDTPMATAGISKEHIAGMVSRQAFKRIAQASDIAGAVMFLTGEDSGWVTGQTILVNAGASFL